MMVETTSELNIKPAGSLLSSRSRGSSYSRPINSPAVSSFNGKPHVGLQSVVAKGQWLKGKRSIIPESSAVSYGNTAQTTGKTENSTFVSSAQRSSK